MIETNELPDPIQEEEKQEEKPRCQHEQFHVMAEVRRSVEPIWPHVVSGLVLMRVVCKQCGMPFLFANMPMSITNQQGISNGVASDGLTLVLNVSPQKPL